MYRTVPIVTTIIFFSLPCQLHAVSYWTGGGADRLWTNADNWDHNHVAPPSPSDSTFIRLADMESGSHLPMIEEGMDIEIRMLSLEAANGLLRLDMTGGALYCNQSVGGDAIRLGAGSGTGQAELHISGGTITTHDRIRIGWGYAGRMYLSGNASVYAGSLGIASDTGLLDITGEHAAFFVSGDHSPLIQGYIQAGVLTANGGQGTIVYDFDQTLSGYTAIKAASGYTEPSYQQWTDGGTDSSWANDDNWSTGHMPMSYHQRIGIEALEPGRRGPILTADMPLPPGFDTFTARAIRFEPPNSQITLMTIEGGQLSLSEEFWLIAGTSTGRAILEMKAGVLNVGTELRVGGHGSMGGHVQLDGGSIHAGWVTMRSNGAIDIKGDGKLILDSNVVDEIQQTVDSGRITAYSGTGQVIADYDELNDKTVVTALMLTKEASISIKTNEMSEWSADRFLHGRFHEHRQSDSYPGIYEQYIINTSFVEWYRKDESSPTPLKDVKEGLVFTDIDETEGVAFPWEPLGLAYDPIFELSAAAFNSQTCQKIHNTADHPDACVGVKQRIALPDYRVDSYQLKFYARSNDMAGEIEVFLRDYATGTVFDVLAFQPSAQWQSFTGVLDLRGQKASSKVFNRRGIYELAVVFRNSGQVFLDQLTLIPTDAVDGRWNPETIAMLDEVGITCIRWPGGNTASGYNWRDGIGPLEQRPTRPNLAWAGLENNHMGTDEFLEFCELTNLTPIICVGFDFVSVQEAANWVEYVNGCPLTTQYGAMRAQNGRVEPYNIKIWQIGNEVYGHWQIGHTTAEDYATRYLDYYAAMKAVDPTIKMMAMGRDPGYPNNDNNAWNKILFEIIGDKMDYLDIHRYVRGIRNADDLANWDLTHLSEIYLAYPTQYEAVVIDSIRQLTEPEQYNLPNIKLAVTEWAQYLSVQVPRTPHRWSMANAVFYAGMMNAFLRNGDFMKISCSHDFSAFINSTSLPPSPRNVIAKMYSDVKADRLLRTEVVCDTFDINTSLPQIQTFEQIPYLDAAALWSEDGGEIVLFAVNRSLTSGYDVTITLEGMPAYKSADIELFTVNDDYLHFTPNSLAAQTWLRPQQAKIETQHVLADESGLTIHIPACSVVKITFSRFNLRSFSLFASQWLGEGCSVDNLWCQGCDFDQNGSVDHSDLLIFIKHWLALGQSYFE